MFERIIFGFPTNSVELFFKRLQMNRWLAGIRYRDARQLLALAREKLYFAARFPRLQQRFVHQAAALIRDARECFAQAEALV